MVDTWRDSWFEPGLRVLYTVPREVTDAVLPLTVTPAPQAIARHDRPNGTSPRSPSRRRRPKPTTETARREVSSPCIDPEASRAVLADDDPKWRPSAFEAVVFDDAIALRVHDGEALTRAKARDPRALANLFAWLSHRSAHAAHARADDKVSRRRRDWRGCFCSTRFSRKNKRALYRLLTSLMRLPENLEREFDAGIRALEGPVA